MTGTQKNIWKLIKQFRFNSIFFSYLKYTLLLLSVPFTIITIFISLNTYLNIRNETEDRSFQVSERSRYVFEDIFNSIDELYHQFTSNKETLYLITADTTNTDTYRLKQSVSSFYDRVHSAISGSNILDSIYLYSERNSYVYATDSSNELGKFSNLDWYREYISQGKNNTICHMEINGNGVISIVMNIYAESKHSGVLVFNISKSYIDAAISDFETSNITYSAFLMNGKKTAYSLNEKIFSEAENESLFSYTHNITGYPASYKGFFKCNIGKIALKRMLPIAVPYFIFTIISIIFVAFMCSLKFYRSISDIITIFETITTGTDIYSENFNELHYINDNIVNMLLHSQQVENDLVIRLSELKKAQSIALQTQMNPHFLFNTLNLVNTIIIEDCGRDTDAVIIINTLANLLNSSLDTKTYIVAVESELDYAKKYIDIELIRNDYNFIIDWDISPDVLQYKTLKMILQPILENAVFHGIRNITKDKIGKISVRAYLENKDLVFSVTDNGEGIKKDILEQLTAKLSSNEIAETKHIGIANVNSRIRLIYGDEYGCSISTSSSGTTIAIKQPVREID